MRHSRLAAATALVLAAATPSVPLHAQSHATPAKRLTMETLRLLKKGPDYLSVQHSEDRPLDCPKADNAEDMAAELDEAWRAETFKASMAQDFLSFVPDEAQRAALANKVLHHRQVADLAQRAITYLEGERSYQWLTCQLDAGRAS